MHGRSHDHKVKSEVGWWGQLHVISAAVCEGVWWFDYWYLLVRGRWSIFLKVFFFLQKLSSSSSFSGVCMLKHHFSSVCETEYKIQRSVRWQSLVDFTWTFHQVSDLLLFLKFTNARQHVSWELHRVTAVYCQFMRCAPAALYSVCLSSLILRVSLSLTGRTWMTSQDPESEAIWVSSPLTSWLISFTVVLLSDLMAHMVLLKKDDSFYLV